MFSGSEEAESAVTFTADDINDVLDYTLFTELSILIRPLESYRCAGLGKKTNILQF